jgi:hypothetical protein
MQPHLGFSLPIQRMSSRTSPGIGGLPPDDLRRKGPLPSHQLPVPAKERLRGNQERGPPSTREDPADCGHEQTVATAKMRPAHLALEDLQLMAKDYQLDLGVHLFVVGASDQPDDTAQQ